MSVTVVTLQFADLLAGKDVTEEIHKAYGPNGLGALTIAGIPNFPELRKQLLPLTHKLAHLPKDQLAKLEDDKSQWNAGWSHGREKLGDNPDTFKGSFYANPLYDNPARSDEEKQKYPTLVPDNIWPRDSLPELEPAVKNLGKVMFETVLLLAKQIDKLTHRNIPTYEPDTLYNQLVKTRKLKGRALYYYPTDAQNEDSWIGWHNDSGYLTALTSAMFFDDTTGKVIENPDPKGGLWIVSRGHEPVHVKIPADHMAVQCGECLQVLTGGMLVATPHAVRAAHPPADQPGLQIGRGSFPLFVDTNIDFPMSMPKGVKREQVFDKTVHSRVPPLETRWTRDGMLFSEFLANTFDQYYAWNKQNGGKGAVMM